MSQLPNGRRSEPLNYAGPAPRRRALPFIVLVCALVLAGLLLAFHWVRAAASQREAERQWRAVQAARALQGGTVATAPSTLPSTSAVSKP